MRLLLVRHGETVDNVASLYAGSRDSALTNHGVLQCRRLADHLVHKLSPAKSPSSTPTVGGEGSGQSAPPASTATSCVYLFSSNLQRAVKTGEIIRDRLVREGQLAVHMNQRAELREKHFGSGEGQSFIVGTKRDKPHVGAETSTTMRARADSFLDSQLLPLLLPAAVSGHNSSSTVVIVAHGIILGVLFRCLCDRIPNRSTFDPEVKSNRAPTGLDGSEVSLSWSNTGYIEARLSLSTSSHDPRDWSQVSMNVTHVNAADHLKGLRKTRGGIGSARFDDKQKTINSFFTKKRKLADAAD